MKSRWFFWDADGVRFRFYRFRRWAIKKKSLFYIAHILKYLLYYFPISFVNGGGHRVQNVNIVKYSCNTCVNISLKLLVYIWKQKKIIKRFLNALFFIRLDTQNNWINIPRKYPRHLWSMHVDNRESFLGTLL